MEDIIDIIVTETTNLIEITSQPTDEIIDVNIIDNREDVTLNVTPTVVEININSLTGNFGVNWGEIDGTLSNQTDLQNALNLKADLVGGKVPSSQLPSYVDDVVEVANYAALPATGETGKIYITIDTNYIYRWTGSVYVEIKDSSAVWGAITGTLSNQTDLQNALNAKLNLSGGTLTGGLYINPANSSTVGLDVASNTFRLRTDSSEPFNRQLTTTIGSGTLVKMQAAGYGATYVTDLGFYTSSGSAVNTTPNLYLTGGDNRVGVNTTTPSYSLDVQGTAGVSGNLTAGAIIKSGGTSSQFLKADGSVDSNTYATTSQLHNPVTLGTANGLSLSTQVLSLGLASGSANGALSSTDWSTFNSKQAALSGTGFVKISGTTISYDNSTYLTTSSAASTYLPLTGGTLSGGLNGTTATFTGDTFGLTGFFTRNSADTFIGSSNNTSGITVNGATLVTKIVSGGNPVATFSSAGNLTLTGNLNGTNITITNSLIAKGGTFNGGASYGGIVTIDGLGSDLLMNRANTSNGSSITLLTNAVEKWNIGLRSAGTTDNFFIYNSNLLANALTINSATSAVTFTGALSGTSATFTSSVTAGNTSIFSNGSGLSAIFSNGGAVGNYNAIELRGGTAGTAVNWQISKDNSTANAFELAPSTVAGGTTYGSPVFKIVNSGAATFSSSVSVGTNLTVGSATGGVSAPTNILMDSTYRTGGAAFNALKLYLYKSSTETYGLGLGDLGDLQYWAGTTSTGAHRWFTSQTERMRITSSGNVGIGTTSPTALLTVAGTSDLAWSASTSKLQISRSGTVARLQNYDNGSASSLALQWDGGDITTNASNLIFNGQSSSKIQFYSAYSGSPANVGLALFNTSGTTVIGLNANGGGIYTASLGTGLVYSNAGNLTSTNPSDSRLKKNIKTISYGLSDIMKLRPVSYDWKEDNINQGIQFGFIAQEVQEVMPDAIKEFGEETKFLGLEKDAIYATLVNAVKELKAELDTLKNK